jgi:hypothetical protein
MRGLNRNHNPMLRDLHQACVLRGTNAERAKVTLARKNSPATIEGLIRDNASVGYLSNLETGSPNLLLFNGFLRRRPCCG